MFLQLGHGDGKIDLNEPLTDKEATVLNIKHYFKT